MALALDRELEPTADEVAALLVRVGVRRHDRALRQGHLDDHGALAPDDRAPEDAGEDLDRVDLGADAEARGLGHWTPPTGLAQWYRAAGQLLPAQPLLARIEQTGRIERALDPAEDR